MQAFAHCPACTLSGIRYLLTDIDDTLTHEGRLAASTLAALERLDAAGIKVIPVTGGCAGWCDHIARAWPVASVIGENGLRILVAMLPNNGAVGEHNGMIEHTKKFTNNQVRCFQPHI